LRRGRTKSRMVVWPLTWGGAQCGELEVPISCCGAIIARNFKFKNHWNP
jgi:hypothetical protein